MKKIALLLLLLAPLIGRSQGRYRIVNTDRQKIDTLYLEGDTLKIKIENDVLRKLNLAPILSSPSDPGITSDPTGRVNGEGFSNIIAQPWSDSESDGDADPGTLILQFDVPPSFIGTGTTLSMDDYRGYNTGVSSSTSYVLTAPDQGAFTYFFVNAASEPTLDGSGSGITVIPAPGTRAFETNTDMIGALWMLTTSTALQWWILLETP